jgi:photosystem II stability/assembly factor-like uncharacterized protein
VTGFATGGGNAYVATTRSFLRSPVSANAWRSQPLPFASQGAPLTVAAHGLHLWLLVMPRAKAPRFDLLARSRDGGTTFTTGRGPCYPGLGGDLEPTSASTIWAVCPTGMLAGASRSTDGGVTFDVLHTPTLINATMLAPASNATAVLAPNPQSQLLRTTDGGRSWKRVHTPERSINMPWVGFTDARVGAALVEVSPTRTVFWRTHDGGARWSEVNLP